ncbi:ClbS/DfsB family four-helix bundle protein [Lacticaseibacillus suilingensis]|uniref:ClbS/DfsB family four-helix bundle protein n=1 Tax=Lacticaseibacillus suilingensis TaxID=2799577 RepID=A0ABW4BG76_9LACO|nr:ClbS/DfsB family four-helix bundle protein [Lacticaseibacillus suilingensis]
MSLHEALMAQFEARTNEELFLKGFYDWTGALSLGEYAAMVGPSHDAWAIKVLKHYRQHLTVASN